jgi:hypothetical protein
MPGNHTVSISSLFLGHVTPDIYKKNCLTKFEMSGKWKLYNSKALG